MKKEVFNIGNNQNEKLETDFFRIAKNVMIYGKGEAFIVLKNISGVSLGKEPSKPYSKWLFIVPIIGLLFLLERHLIFILAGLLMIGICGVIIYSIYENNLVPTEYIMVHLNSGKTIFFKCTDHDFSVRVMDTIINCINADKSYDIDFNSCTIQNVQNIENNTTWR